MRVSIAAFTAFVSVAYGQEAVQRQAIVNGMNSNGYDFFAFNKLGANKGCGATVIHEDILLTAAHCRPVFEGRGAYIGALELEGGVGGKVTNYQEFIEDDFVLEHPHYKSYTEENNIMLVKLSKFTTVAPVALNDKQGEPSSGKTVTTTGFGTPEWGGDLAETLQEVELQIVETKDCEDAYSDFIDINGDFDICATAANKDTCGNDSGGPLLDEDGQQVGIVSFGKNCAEGFPGVFVRVSHYIDWIEDSICQLSANPPSSCAANKAGSSLLFNSFLAFGTGSGEAPTHGKVVQVVKVAKDLIKRCYREKYNQFLYSVETTMDPMEHGNVGAGRPNVGPQFSIYIQFPQVEVTFREGATVVSTNDFVNMVADCINGNEDFILDDLRGVGGAFDSTMEVIFKAPIGEDRLEVE